MTQALYRKWRPQTLDAVVGQEHVVQTMHHAIVSGRIAHAYLFAGPRGTGKTTLARLLAKAVNCLNPDPALRPDDTCSICTAITEGRLLDLIELDAASNRGIDEIRDLRDKINFAPGEARYKVYIIDEVHMLTEPAFNALLKTLEEPPPHAIFVLATTDPQKVPVTIVSRCQSFAFRRFTLDEIVACLQPLVEAEGLQVDPAALALIARQATGSMRDAISLLDQLAAGGAVITVERAQDVLGTGALDHVMALLDALAARDAAGGLNAINAAIDQGADARQLARQIVEYLRGLLWIKLEGGSPLSVSSEQRVRMTEQAARLDLDRLLKATRLFNQAAAELRTGWQPQLPLELACIEALNQTVEAAPNPAPARSAPRPTVRPREPAPIQSDAATPAPKAAAPKPDAAKNDLKLSDIVAQWPAILADLKARSVPTEALVREAKPIQVEGNTVVLQWPMPALHERFEKGKGKKDLLDDVLSRLVGRRIVTRSVVEDDPVLREAKRLGAEVRPVEK